MKRKTRISIRSDPRGSATPRFLAWRRWENRELDAVRTQIERTDRLIDQVVYRLYGLTEAEIVVVEDAH